MLTLYSRPLEQLKNSTAFGGARHLLGGRRAAISIAWQTRPVISAAMIVVPEPLNGS